MTSFLFLIISFFTAISHAETVTEKIAENKYWSANKIDNHRAWNTTSCVASTLNPIAALEIYAEKTTDGVHAEPTVQILFAADELKEEAFSAEVSSDNSKKWLFTRASTPLTANIHAMMAQLDDRADIINRIKKDNTLNLKLKNAKGKTIKDIPFSLSGSSKTITSLFESCSLTFDTL